MSEAGISFWLNPIKAEIIPGMVNAMPGIESLTPRIRSTHGIVTMELSVGKVLGVHLMDQTPRPTTAEQPIAYHR